MSSNLVHAAKMTLFVLIASYLQSRTKDPAGGPFLAISRGQYVFTHQSKYVQHSGSPNNAISFVISMAPDKSIPVEGVNVLFPVELPQWAVRRSITELLMDIHVVVGASKERGIHTLEQAHQIALLIEADVQAALSDGSVSIFDYPNAPLGGVPVDTGKRCSWMPFVRPRKQTILRWEEAVAHRLLTYRVFVPDD